MTAAVPTDPLDSPLNVGDLVLLPERLRTGLLGDTIVREPGRIDSIGLDGWAIVDRGQLGQFGAWLHELRQAESAAPGAAAGGAR